MILFVLQEENLRRVPVLNYKTIKKALADREMSRISMRIVLITHPSSTCFAFIGLMMSRRRKPSIRQTKARMTKGRALPACMNKREGKRKVFNSLVSKLDSEYYCIRGAGC